MIHVRSSRGARLRVALITVLRSFMSVERTRAPLGGKREGIGNVMATGLGVITPS